MIIIWLLDHVWILFRVLYTYYLQLIFNKVYLIADSDKIITMEYT